MDNDGGIQRAERYLLEHSAPLYMYKPYVSAVPQSRSTVCFDSGS